MFENQAVGRVLNKSYDESSGILTIEVQITKDTETTDYFIEELEKKYDSAFICPIGQADENNRGYVSDYVNLHNPYYLFPRFPIKEPLMIVLANKNDEKKDLWKEGFRRI